MAMIEFMPDERSEMVSVIKYNSLLIEWKKERKRNEELLNLIKELSVHINKALALTKSSDY